MKSTYLKATLLGAAILCPACGESADTSQQGPLTGGNTAIAGSAGTGTGNAGSNSGGDAASGGTSNGGGASNGGDATSGGTSNGGGAINAGGTSSGGAAGNASNGGTVGVAGAAGMGGGLSQGGSGGDAAQAGSGGSGGEDQSSGGSAGQGMGGGNGEAGSGGDMGQAGAGGQPGQSNADACGTPTPYNGGVRAPKLEGFGAKATGGKGGKEVTVSSGQGIHEAMCSRGSDTEPLIIKLDGTVNHGNTAKASGSCDTNDDTIQFKNVSNISLIGVGNKGVLDQIGIHIVDSSNIIIQNINVKNVKKSGSPTSNGGDAIGIENSNSDLWIDHCTLEASGGEDQGYDGLLDMKGNTRNVTVSYTRFFNSGRGGLIGSGDGDTASTNITFHHNYYEKIESRTPLMRGATVHIYNNHYNGLTKSGINSRIGGKAKVEHNYFENARNPLGTFYTDQLGTWEVKDNCFESTVVWEPTDSDQEKPAGPNPVSTGTIGVSYNYSLDPALDVPGIVKANAGHGKL